MAMVIPRWLDQVPGIDFSPEKELLSEIEVWAQDDGWIVTDGHTLSSGLRERTDVLIESTSKDRQMRIAVLPKGKGRPGTIRIDTSTHRIFELIYQPRTRKWRVETAAVPLSDDFLKSGWDWLKSLAFRP